MVFGLLSRGKIIVKQVHSIGNAEGIYSWYEFENSRLQPQLPWENELKSPQENWGFTYITVLFHHTYCM